MPHVRRMLLWPVAVPILALGVLAIIAFVTTRE